MPMNMAGKPTAGYGVFTPPRNRETYGLVRNPFQSGAGKIYETALDVRVDEFDTNMVAHF